MKIAFIGLGHMGMPMARHLIEAGHEVWLYNRTRERAEKLRSPKSEVADSPGQAATGSEVVITMLSDDRAAEDVVLGRGGTLEAAGPNTIHISMSTISVALSRRLAGTHQSAGQHFIAAPVFGRPDQADAGQLFILAAGPAAHVDRCQPLFDVMGQKTFRVGEEPPVASLFKLAGNFLITAVIEGLAESFALVRKSGADVEQFLDVLTNSLFTAPVYRGYGEKIANDEYQPAGFKLPLGLKDNHLLLAAAEEEGVPMPLAGLVRGRFRDAMAHGLEEADWAAIARLSYRDAGLAPPEPVRRSA